MQIVPGGYLRIFGSPSVQSCAPYRYLLPNVYLFVEDIANPDLFVCGCRTLVWLDSSRFYEEQCHPSSRSAFPKKIRSPIVEVGRFRYNLSTITAVTAPPLVGCVDWSLLLLSTQSSQRNGRSPITPPHIQG